MRANISIPLAAIFILSIAAAPSRASSAAAGQSNANSAPGPSRGHIWTNADLDELRAKGLISIVGVEAAPDAQAAATVAIPPAGTASADSTAPSYEVRELDPAWYAEQAGAIQAEIDVREAALRDAQTALQRAASGITEPGVDMGRGNLGVTPDAGVAVLEAQVADARADLDALADLARHNGIAPGTLRTE